MSRRKELVTVFTNSKHNKVNNPMKIGGTLRFISIEQGSGEFPKAVVLSILSIMERR
jgi:hypothetical protein